MDPSLIGWREALLLAVVVIAAYLGYALLRLSQLRARPPAAVPPPPAAPEAPPRDEGWRAAIEARLAALDSELAALRDEVAKLRALGNVSPHYHEAVDLARQGLDAEAIAQRCGISVGEAELVRALSRKPPE